MSRFFVMPSGFSAYRSTITTEPALRRRVCLPFQERTVEDFFRSHCTIQTQEVNLGRFYHGPLEAAPFGSGSIVCS